jgi:hypothetical protein
MQMTFETIEHAAKQLTTYQKAILARRLLEDLDETDAKPDEIEAMWIAEAESRLDAFLRGEIGSSPTEEVVARIRARLAR